MGAQDDELPYWVLVSILTSSVPLDQGLALALHRVALELYKTGVGVGHVDHALAHGQVKNLKKEALVGAACQSCATESLALTPCPLAVTEPSCPLPSCCSRRSTTSPRDSSRRPATPCAG